MQELLQDETRQKMTLASKVRALEEEKNGQMERLEEQEEKAKELTRQIQTHTQQVKYQTVSNNVHHPHYKLHGSLRLFR